MHQNENKHQVEKLIHTKEATMGSLIHTSKWRGKKNKRTKNNYHN